jgi:CzcA family heavy metal efflux pump
MKQPFFIKFKNPILAIVIFSLIGGYYISRNTKTALLPNVVFPKVKIIVDNGEQPVDKMMITVTRPLEEAIKQVPFLQKIYSTTSRGESEINIFLNWDADVDISEQQIESRINQIKNVLPPDVDIKVEKMNMYSVTTVMGYVLSSPDKKPIDLNWTALYTVKPFLSQVEGVSRVEILGGKNKEYWVNLNAIKMSSLGITPAMVRDAIQKNDFIESNGYSSDYNRMYLSITDASVYNIPQLENIIVNSDSSGYVRLKDIAAVQVHEELAFTRVTSDGKQALLVDVLQQPNANLIDFSQRMDEKIKELQKILPSDVHISTYYDQAAFVNEAVSGVKEALLIGLLLAIVMVVIFLRSLRASIAVLLTIPVTLSLTVMVVYAAGYTFNIMTLGAIAAAIGLIIDDAIVIVEQIHRIREEFPEMTAFEASQKAIHKLLPFMIGSSLSTIVIFVPFAFLLSGISGAYFKVLTYTMLISLTCSFFATWLILPVIYSYFSKALKSTKTSHKVKRQKWVIFFVTYPWTSLVIDALMVGSFIYIIPKIETGFLPDMDEGTIVLDYFTPPGTSFERTDSILRKVEDIVKSTPEVKTFVRRTGAEMGFFVTEPNRGDFLIQLKNERKKTTDEVIDEIRESIIASGQPLHIEFGQRIEDILGDLIGETEPIQVKIYGDDPEQLNKIAVKVADSISRIPGTADVFNGVTIAGPYINIRPDLTKLKQYNISPDDFQFQLATQLNGSLAGTVFEKQQMTNIRLVQGNSNYFQSLTELKNSYIFFPDGRLQPITHLATITPTEGVAEINRENLQPVVMITSRLNNRDLGSAMIDVKKVMKKIALPQGYHYSFGGTYEEQQQSFHELLIILITSCLFVFSIMLFLFKDFKAAFVVLIIAVLGVTGSCIALFLTGTPLNVGSYTGLIMIVGIIGENAIFTFQQFAESREKEGVKDALVFAISTRLRPKIMTALCAIIALSPLAFGVGTGATLHRPLAIAVIGGFVTGLPLLLIVYPAFLAIVYKDKKAENAA